VPRRDCIPRRGCLHARNGAGGDHHAAGSVAQQQENLAGEGPAEAAPGLDRRAHNDELRAALGGDTRDLLAEAPRPRPDDFPPDADAVGADDRLG
jgi:hypothetical protein